ncbi:MAG: hypothetical protein HYV92_09840, partial [Candidatus Rokubacteria bacterium]|nr:hypothetical protein [Candidatus Rokubacteria bacterium]
EEWNSPNIYEDNPVGEKGKPFSWSKTGEQLPEHKTWFFYLARICNHCTYPACLAACPRKAIYKRPEDGIVLIDQKECRGYRKCVEACPYKKSMYRGNTRISEKCIACYPRIEGRDQEAKGKPWQTRCMAACIGQIRLQGLVRLNRDGTWAEDRQHPLYYLVHVAKVALPLYPQFGTAPNGYYIPPRWVPRPYLRQMFGPGVDAAIERYENPDRELTAVLQLFNRAREITYAYKVVEGPKVYEGRGGPQGVRGHAPGPAGDPLQRHRHSVRQERRRALQDHRRRAGPCPPGQACQLHLILGGGLTPPFRRPAAKPPPRSARGFGGCLPPGFRGRSLRSNGPTWRCAGARCGRRWRWGSAFRRLRPLPASRQTRGHEPWPTRRRPSMSIKKRT